MVGRLGSCHARGVHVLISARSKKPVFANGFEWKGESQERMRNPSDLCGKFAGNGAQGIRGGSLALVPAAHHERDKPRSHSWSDLDRHLGSSS